MSFTTPALPLSYGYLVTNDEEKGFHPTPKKD